MAPKLLEVKRDEEGKSYLNYNFHTGQLRAWNSDRRIVAILGGTQSGKTTFGPPWLFREIQGRGPGDYLAVAPTYPLMSKKLFPEFLHFFRHHFRLGDYHAQDRIFTFSDGGAQRLFGRVPDVPTKVFFGHATDPDSLESATAKAAWLDEAGQKKFRLGSWEAILRRLSLHRGRVLITTTPYDLGWLKQKIYDPWEASKRNHPEIEVVSFESVANPAFPREEFERAFRDLPRWKFDLFYRAKFTRPAGMIYDIFQPSVHLAKRFRIPQSWPRYLGMDFGAVNTAAVLVAEELGKDGIERLPTGRYIVYRTHHPARRGGERLTPAGHVAAILQGEPGVPEAVGGSSSEDDWREEFGSAGLMVREPDVRDVEVGIDRVYGILKQKELVIFEDLEDLRDEFGSYSRELDDMGNPTERIENKADYHLLDALRYAVGWIKSGTMHSNAMLAACRPEGLFSFGDAYTGRRMW